jgi:hypothetical protein
MMVGVVRVTTTTKIKEGIAMVMMKMPSINKGNCGDEDADDTDEDRGNDDGDGSDKLMAIHIAVVDKL